MHKHTCYDLGQLAENDVVEVKLESSAVNARLMVKDEYLNHYLNNKTYNFYGGVTKETPYRISVPNNNHWYLVVDLEGLSGTSVFNVSVKRNTAAKVCPSCGTKTCPSCGATKNK